MSNQKIQPIRWHFLTLLSFLGLCGTVVGQTAAAPPDVQPISMKELSQAASNPLAWQAIAGKTVGVYGGEFFEISQITMNGPRGYLISIRSNKYAVDITSCSIADDSMTFAATLTPGDPVILIGKLAGSPHDMRAGFDGTCHVFPGKVPGGNGAASSSSSSAPVVTETIYQFQAEASANSVRFQQKYIGKTVRLTGLRVGRMAPDSIVLYVMTHPHNIPLDAMNCLVTPAVKAKIANLNKDQVLTVTGVYKDLDDMRTGNLAPILENCTF